MAHFASWVKVDWQVCWDDLADYADEVATAAATVLGQQGISDLTVLPLFGKDTTPRASPTLMSLPEERMSLLLRNSISPLPLHKALVLLAEIDCRGPPRLQSCAKLALATALVRDASNLKFGPEVGVGRVREDVAMIDAWLGRMTKMAEDLQSVAAHASVHAEVAHSDARTASAVLKSGSVDAVITSPPYPNEKDYTRTTRLESVVLGMICNKVELRELEQGMIRSNTRGAYKADTDDREVEDNASIRGIADAIERRRIALGKTSGFERMYSRVTKLYFGGMTRHLAALRPALVPGAKLVYVVGD